MIWPRIALLALALVLGGCSQCDNTVISEYSWPGSQYRAVVFERSCGATTGFGTDVSILVGSKTLPDGQGNTFIADDNHGEVPLTSSNILPLRINWMSPNRVTIEYPKNARVFLKSEKVLDVEVTFAEYQPN